MGVQVLMAEALPNEPKYKNAIASYCDNAVSQQTRSPQGQLFYSQWGSLRYASNAVFACLQVSDKITEKLQTHIIFFLFGIYFLQAADLMPDKAESYTTLAEGQMEYILGKTGRRLAVNTLGLFSCCHDPCQHSACASRLRPLPHKLSSNVNETPPLLRGRVC